MLRIGTVPYLVARPLTWGLAERRDVELVLAPPAELVRRLADGRLDVALASSILAVEDPRFRLWQEGPVIASEGPIRSVIVLARPGLTPPQIRSVVLDPHSRTGQALARIVLRDLHGAAWSPRAVAAPASPFEAGADAVQLIGDPALAAAAARPAWTRIDLGEDWWRLTGLPFVFAGWIGRPGFDPAEATPFLGPAAEAGLARRAELAAEGVPGVALDFLRSYLEEDLRYFLPAQRLRAALAEFGRRLALAVPV